jgi:carbonic anhydrase/acetyltransferase-like protein (isoleucine patch superfamily)
MALTLYDGLEPKIHSLAYVHPSAQLLGDVVIGEEASVWPTCVLRGDSGAITLGARSNFQDASIAHASLGLSKTTIGEECTIGHRVIVHGCTIGNQCLIGMGSILLDGVEIGDSSFVASGALLTPGKVFPPRSFIMGSPAKRVRDVGEKELAMIAHSWAVYRTLAHKYRAG